ncbi:MAG: hypothetical protein ABIZ70_09800 [Gemmatimonadales bacterium]
MYSTCLFCNTSLGQNEVLESLPVGRRIAFDSAHGRLWVICPGCARWNLVPFDSRLETIDAAEGLFHDTRTRFSTDNIGLARLREGLELVRIGPALRPEFAAWRYGAQFASRRRRNLFAAGVVGVAGIAAFAGAEAALGSSFLWYQGISWIPGAWNKRRIRVRHQLRSGELLTLTHSDVSNSFIRRRPDGWCLGLNARTGVDGTWCSGIRSERFLELEQSEAEPLLARILPVVAGTAGSAKQVVAATTLLESDASIMGITSAIDQVNGNYLMPTSNLASSPPVVRLAMEMVANEETERRALHGELALLERQWKEAERLAKISDSLALPESTDAEFDALKRASRSSIPEDRAP